MTAPSRSGRKPRRLTAAETAAYLAWPVGRIYKLSAAGAIPHRSRASGCSSAATSFAGLDEEGRPKLTMHQLEVSQLRADTLGRMPPPLIRRTVDVVLGDPHAVADRIEVVFGAQKVAVVCRIDETFVNIDVSTLDLADTNLEENIEAWITQAATDVAASVQWAERR